MSEHMVELLEDMSLLVVRRLGPTSVDPGRFKWRLQQVLLDELDQVLRESRGALRGVASQS